MVPGPAGIGAAAVRELQQLPLICGCKCCGGGEEGEEGEGEGVSWWWWEPGVVVAMT